MGKTLGYGEITVANMTEPFTVMLQTKHSNSLQIQIEK